jgi:hypothetical protein
MPTKAHHFLMALRRHQKNLSRPPRPCRLSLDEPSGTRARTSPGITESDVSWLRLSTTSKHPSPPPVAAAQRHLIFDRLARFADRC